MQIDVILDSRADPDDLAELAQLAEDNGLGAIWTSSLLDARDPFANLTVAARATTRIRLGPIAVNPFDIHPVRIATSLLTLNEFAHGRANIVIGGGGEALEALKVSPHRRVRAVRECVEIIKGASASTSLSYEGELYQVQRYHPAWATAEPPRVYVGANMEQMLRMAAKTGDGIFMSDMTPGLVAAALQTAQHTESGSGLPGIQRSNNFFAWHVHDDLEDAKQEARTWLALRALFRTWVTETFLSKDDAAFVVKKMPQFFHALSNGDGVIKDVPDEIIEACIANVTLTSSTDHLDPILARLQDFKDAGLTSIALRLYKNPAKSIKLIGEKIIPALS